MDEYILKATTTHILVERLHLQGQSKSQGEGEMKLLYKWSSGENIIRCFGWYDGDSAFENNHVLPPGGISSFLDEDSSEKKLYGDIFLVLSHDKSIINFSVSDYAAFHDFIYDGHDDLSGCDGEELHSEEDNVDCDDDINEASDEEYETVCDNIEELDYDESEY